MSHSSTISGIARNLEGKGFFVFPQEVIGDENKS
jgi:hypothetical protein